MKLQLLGLLTGLLLFLHPLDAQNRPQVLVETNKGNFIIELFNETPIHRDRFLQHVDQHA